MPPRPSCPRLRLLALAAAASAFAVLGLLLLRRASPGGPTLPEVTSAALEWRDSRWYWRGQTNPLTGWLVDHYDDGQRKSRSPVVNGWLEGRSEGWHTNGQRQVEEHFHAGVSHGLRRKWNADGSKLSEVQVVEGKLHGTFRRWHPDGTLAEEIQMKDGEPDGLSRAYYPSGCLKAEARLRQGKLLGQEFWPDGENRPGDTRADGPPPPTGNAS